MKNRNYNVELYTKYKRPPKQLEKGGGENLVEVAGYITAKERIENMMLAGQNLLQNRKALYDFNHGEEIDEDFIDITRSPNFDMADISEAANYLESKKEKEIKTQKKNDDKSNKKNNSEKGQEPPDDEQKELDKKVKKVDKS